MERSARALWVWAPVVLLMALIYFLSSLSEIPAPPGGMSYTGVHAVVYGVLGMFVLRGAAGARWSGVTAGRVAIAVVVTGVYGATDEYHQLFVAGRSAEIRDLVADIVGAGVGTGLVWAWSIVLTMRERRKLDEL